jgi:hypothetical protein
VFVCVFVCVCVCKVKCSCGVTAYPVCLDISLLPTQGRTVSNLFPLRTCTQRLKNVSISIPHAVIFFHKSCAPLKDQCSVTVVSSCAFME